LEKGFWSIIIVPDIKYIAADVKDVGLIAPLREKTRQYHQQRSPHFKRLFAGPNIDEAYKQALEKAVGGILLDLAEDTATDKIIGYCLSTIGEDNNGEIASIYIEPEYRRRRVGYKLLERALDWMDKRAVIRRTLCIGAGNEEVVDFYRHFNFQVRTIVMEQVKE
jgi:diamine N-acetyltransferase